MSTYIHSSNIYFFLPFPSSSLFFFDNYIVAHDSNHLTVAWESIGNAAAKCTSIFVSSLTSSPWLSGGRSSGGFVTKAVSASDSTPIQLRLGYGWGGGVSTTECPPQQWSTNGGCQPCDTCSGSGSFTAEFDFWNGQRQDNLVNQEFDFSSNHGIQMKLTGWSHTREYAKGFVRGSSGSAYATVTNLTPGLSYGYKVYNYNNQHFAAGSNDIFINGVGSGRVEQSDTTFSSKTGFAVANKEGKIEFKFTRRAHQIHLSKIIIEDFTYACEFDSEKYANMPVSCLFFLLFL